MITFAAIVPHSPLLIPNVGKDNLAKLKKTQSAYELLAQKLASEQVDALLVVSAHGQDEGNGFIINTRQSYEADYENFGDFGTRFSIDADLAMINELKCKNEIFLPIKLISEKRLDHGLSIPLFFLTKYKKNLRFVPINCRRNDNKINIEFGKAIKEASFSINKKIGLIISGDLSHRLTYNSIAGFSPQAKEFDKKIIQNLKKKNWEAITNTSEETIAESAPCVLDGLGVLFGAIGKMNYEFEVLSYESPFGIGYLVGNFKFN